MYKQQSVFTAIPPPMRCWALYATLVKVNDVNVVERPERDQRIAAEVDIARSRLVIVPLVPEDNDLPAPALPRRIRGV